MPYVAMTRDLDIKHASTLLLIARSVSQLKVKGMPADECIIIVLMFYVN